MLMVLPTGAGKSIIYQLPCLVDQQKRISLVICPTVSLIDDQVFAINERLGETVAVALCGDNNSDSKANLQLLQNWDSPQFTITFIYTTPEAVLQNDLVLKALVSLYKHHRLFAVVFDEAHCLSLWGERFRPAFVDVCQRICIDFTECQRIAMTATATVHIEEDIIKLLNMGQRMTKSESEVSVDRLAHKIPMTKIRVSPFKRSLSIIVRKRPARWEALFEMVAQDIVAVRKQVTNSATIVYCLTIAKCEELALHLSTYYEHRGLKAATYHSKMPYDLRCAVHKAWLVGEHVNIVVATCSFGMGINNHKTSMIIHTCLPTSMEEYLQQIGRAGRSEDSPYANVAILYYRWDDIQRVDRVISERLPHEAPISGNSLYEYTSLDSIIQVQIARGRRMLSFVEELVVCRWAAILSYFGETEKEISSKTPCQRCDNCRRSAYYASLDDRTTTSLRQLPLEHYARRSHDVTDLAFDVIISIHKLNCQDNRRFCVRLLVRILLGLQSAVQFNRLSVWASLKGRCSVPFATLCLRECLKKGLVAIHHDLFQLVRQKKRRGKSGARYHVTVTHRGLEQYFDPSQRERLFVLIQQISGPFTDFLGHRHEYMESEEHPFDSELQDQLEDEDSDPESASASSTSSDNNNPHGADDLTIGKEYAEGANNPDDGDDGLSSSESSSDDEQKDDNRRATKEHVEQEGECVTDDDSDLDGDAMFHHRLDGVSLAFQNMH
eukprot:GILJ01019186.1.p1 GENE.GILJ01019186.1~~GILJ01019186.1.p1  ORF type:complete len:723 (-),score=44.04 GILJ01019186.1:46-2214(-)